MKRASLMVVAAVCAAIFAGPAIAADTDHMGNMPMKSKTMKPMAKGHAMHHSRHKMSCYDYAWQSQDMKDCLAKGDKMK